MKNKETRTFGYRLRLNHQEFNDLVEMSKVSGMKTSEFLRMLVSKYKQEYLESESNDCFDKELRSRYKQENLELEPNDIISIEIDLR